MATQRLATALSILFLILQMSCKESPTEPESKNPREYTWDATMLSYPNSVQTRMYSIWGSSPSDVYVSGFSMLGGQKGAMYHYDGKQWTPLVLPSPDYNYLWEMTGFGANDVWVAGARLFPDPKLDSAVVLHYDGVRWSQMLPSHMGVRGLESIWGSSSRNLFFGSMDGKVIRYDGVRWAVDTLYPDLSVGAIGGDETQVFAMGSTYRSGLDDSVMCFNRTSSGWRVVDIQLRSQHTSLPRFGLLALYSPAQGVYYSSEWGVFQWEGKRWVKVFSTSNVLPGLGGSGPNNVIATGLSREGPVIYQWDGTSWDEISLPQGLVPNNVALYAAWTNGREAFIVGNDGAVSYVLHGK